MDPPEARFELEFLSAAKRLKHEADRETDRMLRQLLYLESVVYFMLTGKAILQRKGNVAYHMFNDTKQLLKYVLSKFRDDTSSAWKSKVDILGLRLQSHLYLAIHKTKVSVEELREHDRVIIEQEAGNSTLDENVLQSYKHKIMILQYLKNASTLWEKADKLTKDEHNSDFFLDLDCQSGPLKFHSDINQVAKYVFNGINILKVEIEKERQIAQVAAEFENMEM